MRRRGYGYDDELIVERTARKPLYQESHETRIWGHDSGAIVVRTVPAENYRGRWPYVITVASTRSGDKEHPEFHIQLQHEELRLLIETLTKIENDVARAMMPHVGEEAPSVN